MRIVVLFLIPFTALLHTAVAQKSAATKRKPTVYNHIITENDPADKAAEAAYSAEFNIIEIRDSRAYTAATSTTRVLPRRPRTQSGQPILGDVWVVFIVTSDGRVIEPFIFKSTDKRLNMVVINAVRQWHFAPARLNGSAVSAAQGEQVTFAQLTGHPVAIYAPKPQYPSAAHQHGLHGRGIFCLRLRPDGTVASVNIEKTTGYDLLDKAAVSALQQWRFKPIASKCVRVPVNFIMSGVRPAETAKKEAL